MPWSRYPNILWSCNPNIDLNSSFAFNQISNIFYPKILYISILAFGFICTDSNISFIDQH